MANFILTVLYGSMTKKTKAEVLAALPWIKKTPKEKHPGHMLRMLESYRKKMMKKTLKAGKKIWPANF